MKQRRQHRYNYKFNKMMLTPMIDVFTVILIFLLINHSIDKSELEQNIQVKLPESEVLLSDLPRIRIEITDNQLRLNGKELEGYVPSNPKTWNILRASLQDLSPKPEPVLIISDKETSYRYVDRTISQLAAAGFSEVYFLTEKSQKEVN